MKHSTNMDKEVDEHIVKITGKSAIPAPLAMDQDVILKVTGSVVQQVAGSNQDGTIDVTYKVKAVNIEVQ